MAHRVTFTVPERPVGNADIEFSVHANDTRVGTLKISKGKLVWMPAYAKRYEFGLSWARLAKLMEEHGRRVGR
ncbi:MAG: hypothetical protein IH851_11885 [Armatimonadetes bacterium]|nr:hypothetical protein [Armatimonadota bacterium]